MTLFEKITEIDNVVEAYLSARKGKRYRDEVLAFSSRLEENLINLQNHMAWQTWRPLPAREFVVKEPKIRAIQAPPFPDRIVHHALVRQVEHMFEKRFIHHSYACRKGKGVHAAVHNLQKMLRQCQRKWGSVYVVQSDVSKFFPSLRHSVVMDAVRREIDCEDTIRLWETVLSGYGNHGVGLPIGALTSQLSANISLDRIDHYMTDGCGAGRYLRYMDDIIILCRGRAEARERLAQLEGSLEKSFLKLNPKTQIRPASAGVDWCGYRTWATHILPRKRNVKRAKNRLRAMSRRVVSGGAREGLAAQQIHSFEAYMKHCNGKTLTEKIIRNNISPEVLCKLKITF